MRLIGNKTKLLSAIEAAVERLGVGPGGTFLDVFAGTGAVAQRFKALGWRTIANDRMWVSYVRQKALVETQRLPRGARERLRALEEAPPEDGLVARQYSPAGAAGRRFFTEANARRIDAALETLARWWRAGEIDCATLHVLLAAVIDAADRVANISGTYGAFLKTWQRNALGPFQLRLPEVVPGRPGCRAYRRDANELVREIPCDVLYVDPPYNDREYLANYHVLEAIAERPFVDDPAEIESRIYGRSGLRPYERSAYCDPRRCEAAFRDLIAASRARHVVVSYNEEGILSREQIVAALRDGLGAHAVRFEEISYRRFRSDADRDGRRYRVIEGRARDEIAEWLISASRPAAFPRAPGPAAAALCAATVPPDA